MTQKLGPLMLVTIALCACSTRDTPYMVDGRNMPFDVRNDLQAARIAISDSGDVRAMIDSAAGLSPARLAQFGTYVRAGVLVVRTDRSAAADSAFRRVVSSLGGDADIQNDWRVLSFRGRSEVFIDPNELLVSFAPSTFRTTRDDAINQCGARILHQNRIRPNEYVLTNTRDGGTTALARCLHARVSESIEQAVPNLILPIAPAGRTVGVDRVKGEGLPWHLATGEEGGIDVAPAWEMIGDRDGPLIAVIDDGFVIQQLEVAVVIDDNGDSGADEDENGFAGDKWGWSFNHPDFTGTMGETCDVYHAGHPGITQGTNPEHGTAVAYLAAGSEQDGAAGVCPMCRVLLIVRPLCEARLAQLSEALDYAVARGAEIIVGSFMLPVNAVVDEALSRTKASLFFAAGNSDGSVDYPAVHASTIAVGGSNDDSGVWCQSNHGTGLSLLAPTGSGGCAGKGLSVLSDVEFGQTSGATPVAAGVAGLLLSLNACLEPVEVADILAITADSLNVPSPINLQGLSADYGAGRVNARRVLLPTVRVWFSKSNQGWVFVDEEFSVGLNVSAPYGIQTVAWRIITPDGNTIDNDLIPDGNPPAMRILIIEDAVASTTGEYCVQAEVTSAFADGAYPRSSMDTGERAEFCIPVVAP